MATPYTNTFMPVDNFSVDTKDKLVNNSQTVSEVMLNISGELMKNQQYVSAINPTTNIEAVQDDSSNPVFVSIGNDNLLYLSMMDPDISTGWESVNLMQSFTDYEKAVAFSISQDDQGNINLSFALSKSGETSTDSFVAYMLSDDLTKTDWEKLADVCTQVTGFDDDFVAEKMTIGNSDDGQNPLTMVAGNLNDVKIYYLITDTTAEKYQFPEDVSDDPDAIQDISIGYALGFRAVFYLYKIGDSQTLACTTIPDAGSTDKPISIDYSPGGSLPIDISDYNCISTPTGLETTYLGSDLYVGTDKGIYVFLNAKVEALDTVTDAVADVHSLSVTNDSDNVSVWAFASPDELHYVTGTRGDNYTWNEQILYATGVSALAAIRSKLRQANEALVVNQSLSISHIWQDPDSTLWQQRTITSDDDSRATIDFSSYTAHFNLADQNGSTLSGVELQLTSTEWTYVSINGKYYSLDKDTAATVKTDTSGNISVLYMTDNLSTPTLQFNADWLPDQLNVYPQGKVRNNLTSIKTGDDLANATTDEGNKVVTGDFDSATLDSIASNVNTLNDAGASLQIGTATYDGAVFTTYGTDNDSSATPSALVTITDADSIAERGDSLNSTLGDIMQFMDTVFDQAVKEINDGVTVLEDGTTYVIDQLDKGLKMTINYGNQVYTLVLDEVSAVYRALTWVFNIIEVTLETLIEWLGYFFDWGDILDISDKLNDYFTNYLDNMSQATDALQTKLTGEYNMIQDYINGNIPTDISNVADNNYDDSNVPGLNNSAGNWGWFHLNYSDLFSGFDSTISDSTAEALDNALGDLLTTSAITDTEEFVGKFGTLFKDIANMKVGEIFTAITDLLSYGILNTVYDALSAGLSVLATLASGIKDLMEKEVKVPLFNELMSLVLNGRKFTVLRVLTIIYAVAARIEYKIITGEKLKSKNLDDSDWDYSTFLNSLTSSYETGDPDTNVEVVQASDSIEQSEAGQSSAGDQSGLLAMGGCYVVIRFFFGFSSGVVNLVENEDADGNEVPGYEAMVLINALGPILMESLRTSTYILSSQMATGNLAISWYYAITISTSTLTQLIQKVYELRKGKDNAWVKITAVRYWTVMNCMINLVAQTVANGLELAQKDISNAQITSITLRCAGNYFYDLNNMIASYPDPATADANFVELLAADAFTACTNVILVSSRMGYEPENDILFRIY